MDDIVRAKPDRGRLFEIASEQHGYFTAAQAGSSGFSWDLLSHHASTGRFARVHRGLYRLRDYPSFSREDVVAAWLIVGKDGAVVSHESALDLLELSDVIADAVHLTVPRSKRYLHSLPGVTIHTTTIPWGPADITEREGIRLTAAARTILDTAEAGLALDQVELAVAQALDRGLTTRHLLAEGARCRSRRVAEIIERALDLARPS